MKKDEYYKLVMSKYRCNKCNRLLFYGKIRNDYHIEIACPRCKTITTFERKTIEKNNK